MKLLVNASNLIIGGGIQVGVWFIRSCLEHKIDAIFAVSKPIYEELNHLTITHPSICLFPNSPARNKQAREELVKLANSEHVDAVYTVFGPAYVKFDQAHVSGFADGWLSHSTWQSIHATYRGRWLGAAKMLLTNVYKAWAIRQADAWIFETDVAAKGLAKRAGLPLEKCYVVGNNCAQPFLSTPVRPEPNTDVFSCLYLTADYPHKGVKQFLAYARELQRMHPEHHVKFTISISPSSESAHWILRRAESEDVAQYFDFCGHVPISEAVERVDKANVVMQMSYLETFSANYPEAMARKRPLLVSHYPFARQICKDAAIYVEPSNAQAVVKALITLKTDRVLRDDLVERGTQVLQALPSLRERFEQYLTIINQVAKEE